MIRVRLGGGGLSVCREKCVSWHGAHKPLEVEESILGLRISAGPSELSTERFPTRAHNNEDKLSIPSARR